MPASPKMPREMVTAKPITSSVARVAMRLRVVRSSTRTITPMVSGRIRWSSASMACFKSSPTTRGPASRIRTSGKRLFSPSATERASLTARAPPAGSSCGIRRERLTRVAEPSLASAPGTSSGSASMRARRRRSSPGDGGVAGGGYSGLCRMECTARAWGMRPASLAISCTTANTSPENTSPLPGITRK